MGLPCGPAEPLMKVIKEKYKEVGIWFGVTAKRHVSQDHVLTLYQNVETKDWTLVLYDPTGTACIPFTGTMGSLLPAKEESF